MLISFFKAAPKIENHFIFHNAFVSIFLTLDNIYTLLLFTK